MKISQILKENEKKIIELAERKVIEFADTINRSSEERAFLRKAIIDVAHSSQTNLIKGLIEEVEKMKYQRQCNPCFDKEHCEGKQIRCECLCVKNRNKRIDDRNEEYNQALQKVIDYLKG